MSKDKIWGFISTLPVLILLVSVFVVGPIFIGISFAYNRTWETTEIHYHDIYKAKCPFGVFAVEGRIAGSFLFFAGEQSLNEEYVIKYFNDGVLKTIILNAERTDVIIDGTLQLEETRTIFHWRYLCMEDGQRIKGSYWRIHIPYLPDVEDDITVEWD